MERKFARRAEETVTQLPVDAWETFKYLRATARQRIQPPCFPPPRSSLATNAPVLSFISVQTVFVRRALLRAANVGQWK